MILVLISYISLAMNKSNRMHSLIVDKISLVTLTMTEFLNRHHQLLEGDTESLKVVAKATWVRDGDADSDKGLMAPT